MADDFRDRAIRLFTFLRELTELRTKTIRTSDQYEKVLWFNNIPREPGCYCVAWRAAETEEDREVWVEIRKPRLTPPPKVPDTLEPWLDPRELEDSSREFPDLRERIIVTGESDTQTVFRELAECPDIRPLWERYIEQKWWPWAEEDRRLQTVQKVYSDLFSIYQKQQRLGEAYEVVLGLGYLIWKAPSGHEIRRHVITAQTGLSFNAARGEIRLGPAGEGARPTLEQDMLEPQERPDVVEQRAIEQQVEEFGDNFWDGVQLQSALRSWIHAVSPQGAFDETLAPPIEVSAKPRIHLAPAVILRKRTERSLIRIIQEITQQLRDGQPIPVGVRRLVTILDDAATFTDGDEGHQTTDISPTSTEIYFPLPANDEQREIAEKLAVRHGVLVQGPPGTGKSHTIANLVCHLLAMGQRVLVTTHTARALKVLRDKFPPEIARLCVHLLGDDLAAMQSLEDSVQAITDRYNNWNQNKNHKEISELEKALDEIRRSAASTLNELLALREAETYHHPVLFGSYQGTKQTIAKRLGAEEPRYSWISVEPDEGDEPPISDVEALELLRLMREIDSRLEGELSKELIDPDLFIDPAKFVELVRNESEAIAQYQAAEHHRDHPQYQPLLGVPREYRKALINALYDFRAAYETLLHHGLPWVKEAASQILTDRDRTWTELLGITRTHLKSIGDRARHASERRISALSNRDRSVVRSHAQDLLRHMNQGGRLGFWFFRHSVVKQGIYLIKEVRVDGNLCNKPEPLRKLLEWLDVAERISALHRHWSSHAESPSGPLAVQVAAYGDMADLLERILKLKDKVSAAKGIISQIPGLTEPTWQKIEDLRYLQLIAETVDLEEELQEVRQRSADLETRLRTAVVKPDAHPSVMRLLEAVQTRDERTYGEAYQTLCNLRTSRERLERRRTFLKRLNATAPELASTLISSSSDVTWDSRLAEFSSAWNWARANMWLKRLNDPKAHERLTQHLERFRTRQQEIIRDLAAAKAWRHCFSEHRFSAHVREHLMAWTKAMRRIGKGTGKYAHMHRRAAREHMEQCRSAIPAWIMPIYRVAESVRPGVDAFDVVIVDEASQSGPEALFLHYLAKRIVVVGDDKQISPDFVGITREDVELLRLRHISDLPHSDALGVDNSFFDQAEIRFGGRIRLREHFRCMPEIIQFSNNLCYRSEPLVPLRQYGVGRLTPVIVTRHIEEGYQQGHSPRVINPPEVAAIVEQIKQCCEDPVYDGKSMGVISLLGEDQARLIERSLLDKIGPEEMEKRNLVCGDAYAFQGDERDVMFLSLVSAPSEGRRIGTLASQRDERRFNVAASRAKDQMWLFHTATLNDLSPACLRYRLLEYCLNPHVQVMTVEGLNIEDIRTMARTADRDRFTPPHPFDSWFEVDVFLKIWDRGYRVIPQFEVAGYRIDLVVEGIHGRLAVECDGDNWHGAQRYNEDMGRQRMLERCQWTFWRLRASTFYRDPKAALDGLWVTLDRLAIHPNAARTVTSRANILGDSPPRSAAPDNKAATPPSVSQQGLTRAVMPQDASLGSQQGISEQRLSRSGSSKGTAGEPLDQTEESIQAGQSAENVHRLPDKRQQLSFPETSDRTPRIVTPSSSRDPIFDSVSNHLSPDTWNCPNCQASRRLLIGRNGPFLECSNSKCKKTQSVASDVLARVLSDLRVSCPACSAPASVAHGKFGSFIGCSRYSLCKHAVSWKDLRATFRTKGLLNT